MEDSGYCIIGQRGHLSAQIAEKYKEYKRYSVNDIDTINDKSKVIYTSFLKGNSEDYKLNPGTYLTENFKHIQNALYLSVTKNCDVFFIGSTSGYVKDGEYNTTNYGYGLSKAIASLISAEAKYVSFYNIVLPSLIGYPISDKPQLFEQSIYEAKFKYTTFLKKYKKFLTNSSVVNFLPIEQAVDKINEICVAEHLTEKNIFIEPEFAMSVGEFYQSVDHVVAKANKARNAAERYILSYINREYNEWAKL